MRNDLLKVLYWLEDSGVILKHSYDDFNSKTLIETVAISSKDADEPSNENHLNLDKDNKHNSMANDCRSVQELQKFLNSFEGCELKRGAKSTVFGDGNSKNPDLMVIGEAPGEQEDLQGIPFCGQSGSLLNNMLRSIGLRREDVYITNVVFWRPPMNRRPSDTEVEICRPFVFRHIELVAPRYVVLLGTTALASVLKISSPIGVIRRQIISSEEKHLLLKIGNRKFPVFVSYHPSYLLRAPLQKKESWKDLKNIKAFLAGSNNF